MKENLFEEADAIATTDLGHAGKGTGKVDKEVTREPNDASQKCWCL